MSEHTPELITDMLAALVQVRQYLAQGLPADGKGEQADMYRMAHRVINKAKGEGA